MGKRKTFRKIDLSVPTVAHTCQNINSIETTPPKVTTVTFPTNPTTRRHFDFSRWYGTGIDNITYACQRQIERFLNKQDSEIEVATIARCCIAGLRNFLNYLTLRVTAQRTNLTLSHINRDMIDGYLSYLRERGLSATSQRSVYTATKTVLVALGNRGLVTLISDGDLATFPSNPFPYTNQKQTGETGLPRAQRQAFARAVKTAVMPIWRQDVKPTGELLAYTLLIVALHTGRNTTPLLEMEQDCLRSHPKDGTAFLVLWKRRGHNSSRVAIRANGSTERTLESTHPIRTNLEQLIRRAIALSDSLREEAPEGLNNRVWLYRSPAMRNKGQVITLTESAVAKAIEKLVDDYRLVDTEGKPLRINITRLRKTFSNRIYELSGRDIGITAAANGNTPGVTVQSYLAPGEGALKSWNFMGQCLVNELLTNTLGATARTPMGRCSDSQHGQYAPQDGAACFSFLNCLRCRNYVVTADDLYRLFSFYWRVLTERSRISKKRWDKELAHIPRLIEHDVIAEGLRRKVFNPADVMAARERARVDPHPFWKLDTLPSLEVLQ